MAHDFWNTNMHPITMFKALASQNTVTKYNDVKKSNYLRSNELEGLISSKELIDILGIGAKRIKALYEQLGETPKYNGAQTYYSKALIPKIKKMFVKQVVSLDDYISNKSLMEMFNVSPFTAWKIAKDNKLVKKRFSGTQNYYEREKAIDAFSKYKS